MKPRPIRVRPATAAALALAVAAGHGAAAAASDAPHPGGQTIWRCGNGYQASPCADGRPIVTDPPPAASDRRTAETAARADARRARQLAAERQAREREAARDQQASARLARQQAEALDRERRRPAASPRTPPTFRAQVPKPTSSPAASHSQHRPRENRGRAHPDRAAASHGGVQP